MDTGATYTLSGQSISAAPLDPALYIVATPIGNLSDITLRALETLAACDILACEDTRITRRLLERYGISRKTQTYHEHNARSSGPKLLSALGEGKSVALVSDAGTPLISDPGYRLVSEAVEAGHRVIPIPGVSAVMAAVSASGMPTDEFRFSGFLPHKDTARKARLEKLAHETATLMFFEAPGRLVASLRAIAATMGPDRQVCVARELTKRFETIRKDSAEALHAHFAEATVKGEIVLLIEGAALTATALSDKEVDTILAGLMAEMPASKAASQAATLTGLKKADLYQRLLALKDSHG